MYLTHGWLSAAHLQERGIIKFLGFERSWPPHSIYADIECLAGFLLFGFKDASPYYFSALSVLPALVLLGILARWKAVPTVATWVLFLVTPMALEMVNSIKPDAACAAWFVLGVALLLDCDPGVIGPSELSLRLSPFLVAVMCRPHGLVYLGPLFAAFWAMVWGGYYWGRRKDGLAPLRKLLPKLLLPGVGLLLLTPYYIVAYRWFRGYMRDAYAHRDFYSPARPLLRELTYYLEPSKYRDVLGLSLILAAIALGALGFAAWQRPDAQLRKRALLWGGTTIVAWLGLTAAYYKTPFVGSTFYLLLFGAIPLTWEWLRSRVLGALVACVLLAVGLVILQLKHPADPGDWIGTGRSDPRTRALMEASTRVLEVVGRVCQERVAAAPSITPHDLRMYVFFTSDAFLNHQNFECEMVKAGWWQVDGQSRDFTSDPNEEMTEARRAELVVACEAGANWPFPGPRPADRIEDAVLAALKGDPQFALLAEIPSINGKHFFVFENLNRRNP
jgi:hypothetical protein